MGHLDLPSYFVLLTLSFVIGSWRTRKEAGAFGLDGERMFDLSLAIVLVSILGARVLHVFADGHLHDYVNLCVDNFKVPATSALTETCTDSKQCGYDYVCNLATHTCHPPRNCLAALEVWRGGLTFYGGFVAAVLYAYYFTRKHRLPWGKVADLFSPWIAFGLGLTRAGCFLNGCCYGKISQLAWAVRFPLGSPVWEAQRDAHVIAPFSPPYPVHPTQIYGSLLNFTTFFLLYFVLRPRRRFDGQLFAWLLILKGISRSFVEIFRDDDRGVIFGWLSTSQIISLPLVALGIFLLLRARKPLAATA